MKTILRLLATLLMVGSFAASLSAQTVTAPEAKPAPSAKPKTAQKPAVNVDSFFKNIEKQTREEQKKPGNCLPKPTPKDETTKPIA